MRSDYFINLFVIYFLVVIPGPHLIIAQQLDQSVSAETFATYEKYLKNEIQNQKAAGFVSLVAKDGIIVHHKAFGYSHLDQKDPMQKDHIFYIQSMTKPIISVAFMMLYEEGHFLLTDPVSNYLPSFNDLEVLVKESDGTSALVDTKRPVELWHLLSHTAGFSHGLGQNDYEQALSKALYEHPHKTINERVDTLISYPLVGHPGGQWYYSAAPDVLAVLIEQFSGMPVDQFLQERIFDPLGMDDTGYNLPFKDNSRIAGLHERKDEGHVVSTPAWGSAQGNTVFGGTHGLYSTAEDYFKFAQMVLNGGSLNGQRILGRKTIELMSYDHIGTLQYTPGLGFGLGFGVKTNVANTQLSGSKGSLYWSGLFNTYFFIDPEEKLIGILMSQTYPYSNFYGLKMRQLVYSALD